MLVLTRREGEAIVIALDGQVIGRIGVERIIWSADQGRRVRLGVIMDTQYIIDREEVWRARSAGAIPPTVPPTPATVPTAG